MLEVHCSLPKLFKIVTFKTPGICFRLCEEHICSELGSCCSTCTLSSSLISHAVYERVSRERFLCMASLLCLRSIMSLMNAGTVRISLRRCDMKIVRELKFQIFRFRFTDIPIPTYPRVLPPVRYMHHTICEILPLCRSKVFETRRGQ